MLQRDEAIALVKEVFARWYEMGREVGADPLVLAAGRRLMQMMEERIQEQGGSPADGDLFAAATARRLPPLRNAERIGA